MRAAVLVLPLVSLGLVWQVPDGVALAVPFLGYELALVKGDALSRLFATVFSLMAFAGGLFALNQRRTVELSRRLLLRRRRRSAWCSPATS